jgi:hypothetical protein
LTRGSGEIDERRFAGAVERGTSPGSATFLIEKYRALAQAEGPLVKAAAGLQLWIFAQDRIPPESQRRDAASMADADCRCVTRADGSQTVVQRHGWTRHSRVTIEVSTRRPATPLTEQ